MLINLTENEIIEVSGGDYADQQWGLCDDHPVYNFSEESWIAFIELRVMPECCVRM